MAQIRGLAGGPAIDSAGTTIGAIGRIYLDDRSGEPAWVSVTTGPAGRSEVFIPLGDAQADGRGLRFPHSAAVIAAAPRVEAVRHLDIGQEQTLRVHYAMASGGNTTAHAGDVAPEPPAQQESSRPGRNSQGSNHVLDPADADVMLLREEQLRTGTRRRPSTKVRFRKVVITEEQTITVSVRREELRVDRMDITGDSPDSDTEWVEQQEHVMVLHAEVPVFTMQTRPVESVRITVERVAGQQEVADQVRTEHIAVDDDLDGAPSPSS
ncbi:YsnF/AvaK domain-containing protein [Allobranchiibius sp. GilTou38]|uniref:YsnF/AvaK domain-containing protein n=1 Tax=Allobranchiibius sp. GilTou38 TaxID=2815210 RepID=UPI001AA0E397|nr:YsnF/AvaK domain-containing protein [Allobranchiibius sp. GilTou38]